MKVTVKTKLTSFISGEWSIAGLEVRPGEFQGALCWLADSGPWALAFLSDEQIKISKILLTLNTVEIGEGRFFWVISFLFQFLA